jgi:hypothetical protein
LSEAEKKPTPKEKGARKKNEKLEIEHEVEEKLERIANEKRPTRATPPPPPPPRKVGKREKEEHSTRKAKGKKQRKGRT